MTILGIDPGAHGAIAVLDDDGELLEVLDMPSMPEANGRSATNAPLLAGIFARTHARKTLTVGRFADGRVGEVFLDTPKASAIGEIAADAAIAASVAFQHGAPLETLRHALADRRAGPLGAALALIDAYQAQHKDLQQTGADF